MRALKTHNVAQAVAGIRAFLHAAEIRERVMLYRIQIYERLLFARHRVGDFRVAGKEAIAIVDSVGSAGRQVFLVALPAFAPFQLTDRRYSYHSYSWLLESPAGHRCRLRQ